MFSVRSGNPLPLIMEIALVKSQSARGASHQSAFMGGCLTISHTSLLSHVFATFAFLCLVSLLFKKNERAYILG